MVLKATMLRVSVVLHGDLHMYSYESVCLNIIRPRQKHTIAFVIGVVEINM